jgi:hypothetical protein
MEATYHPAINSFLYTGLRQEMPEADTKFRLVFQLTFPKHCDFPARALQCGAGGGVALSIAHDLL